MAEFELNGISIAIPDKLLTDRIRSKLATGGYEADEARAVEMRVRKGNRVLDLGSGLGYIAALCARLAGPQSVTTVEANPEMLDTIRANLERNGYGEVRLIHGAVTSGVDDGESIEFERRHAFWGAHLATMDSDPNFVVTVPKLVLSNLLESVRPHVVIMDIEGAEQYLFDAPWPGYVTCVMMELHPARYPDQVIKTIVDCLSASGMTYDPVSSRGRIMGFRRLRQI